jgi:hypothetical protein
MKNIIEVLRKHTQVEVCYMIKAKVSEVDQDKMSCTAEPTDGTPAIYNINLRSVLDGATTGFILVSKIGSLILIGFVNNNSADATMLQCSDLEKAYVQIGECLISITADGAQIGKEGSINYKAVLGDTLQAELNKVKQILTILFTVINGAPIPEAGSGAPSSLQQTLSLAFQAAQQPDFSQILSNDLKIS